MLKSFLLLVFCLTANLCFSQQFPLRNRAADGDSIPPQYPEGGNEFVKTVTRKFKVPHTVSKFSYEGVFNIHFTVTIDGIPAIDSINFAKMKFHSKRTSVITMEQVQNDIRSEMDRVFEQIPEWIPGSVDGMRIPYRFILPFSVYFD